MGVLAVSEDHVPFSEPCFTTGDELFIKLLWLDEYTNKSTVLEMNSSFLNSCLVEEYHKGRAIFLKSPSLRSQEEIELLKQWLLERVKLFSSLQLSEGCMEQLAKSITLKQFTVNDVIYEQEEQVENFFIILRGSVSLLFDPNYQINMAAANADSLLKDAVGANSSNTGEKRYRSRSRYGTEIEKLEAGDFFGHKALLQRDAASLHSAFANEPLELLAVKADIFSQVLLQPFQEDFHTKAEFLSGIEFFSGWSPHLIRQLVFTLREKKHLPGECIFRQDIQTHCLYLVKSGSVKLSTHNSRKPPDELVQKIEPEKDFLAEILAEDQPKEPPVESFSRVSLMSGLSVSRVSIVSGMSQVFLRRESIATPLHRESTAGPLRKDSRGNLSFPSISRKGSLTPAAMLNLMVSEKKKAKQNKQEKKSSTTKPVHLLGFKLHEPCPESTIEICNLGPGEFLGEIEAMCQLKHHLFNAVCMTTTVVYEVDLFHVEQLLHRKAPRTLYCILQHIMQKVESWQERHTCIQFFEPLTIVLGQVDKRMSTEGANKPVRRQHGYDATTLALMATRLLGKPITVTGNEVQRKSVEFVIDDSTKDINCTPFSALYGYTNSSLPTCPITNTFKRYLSSPANIVADRNIVPDSLENSPPQNQANNVSKPHLRHRSAPPTSSRRVPKPILKQKFSFDAPPPRQYHTRPNLMSSAKFPVPPPSPYPFQEVKDMIDIVKQGKEEQSEDDQIEIICIDPSPVHKERQRCKSASIRCVCTRSPLPVRPSTAVPFSNRSRSVTPISVDDFSPLSTPSKMLLEDRVCTPSDISISEHVENDELRPSASPPSTTVASPIVIPLATTSEGDLCDQVCNDGMDEGLPNEETNLKESRITFNKDGDSLGKIGAQEALHKITTDNTSVGPSGISEQYKQVRISDKLEFLGPKYISIAPHEAPILPIKEVGNLQLKPPREKNTINTHCLVQALTASNKKSQLDDSETSTTIPEEYSRFQAECSRPNSQLSTANSLNDPNIADSATQECECNDAMATGSGGEYLLRESSASPVYKCISMSFTAPMDYHTRYRLSLQLLKGNQRGTHASLDSMRKEGNLHLARPWMGNGRLRKRSGALQQRAKPTTTRKVVPRPPLNLTPHKQRPFYV